MTADLLKNIINNFSTEEFIHFFRLKNSHFKPYNKPVHYFNDDDFNDCLFIGEIPFDNAQRLHIYSFRVTDSLTERSGKKKQYEKGKRILKETNTDAGIFIFYDDDGNFRFSLIYTEYSGARRRFSYFKRFTYFVSPRLTNKTFLKQIGEGDFSSLEKIKEAFSVEPVTKQFYEEIQNWYFWAMDMDKVTFPEDYKYSNDRVKDKEIRNATNLIRLITRIIFIWFIKEKGLIPEVLFDRDKLKNIIKDFNRPRASNYYNAILQNLFFATLNSKMGERDWAKDEGYPKNKSTHGVKNLYRYDDKFLINEKEVLNLFKEIPFLNGGLFDCLDKEDESGRVIYIDGFTRIQKKQAIIPDHLFFQQDETRVDLSTYGLGSNKQVRGLIEILKSYNFTIDESTPVDQEVALDPELLGKVFENLLASYNPETATTARKATGSYYTPRDIVDYMVDESLKEYFKIQLPGIDEEKIELLVSYAEESPEFSQEEKQRIISAIDRIKILDPACGSGAFPMGILHKLVHILQKIDPNNDLWYELQYQKALRASEEVFKEKDKSEREAMLKEINEAFDESINYPDYARKLYLIENCIYGIDTQPIAIQISKLRFFISLVLDQKVDRTKENLGIRALPNLETKFVAANTLIGLERPKQLPLRNPEIEREEKELRDIRHRYFTAKTRAEKLKLQERDRKIRKKIAQLLINDGWGEQTAHKIASFDLFDQNASADWFDPEWMFGVVDGFDIVIGNPPYIDSETMSRNNEFRKRCTEIFQSAKGNWDLFVVFIEKGFSLLSRGGTITYIVPNKLIAAKYTEEIRKMILSKKIIEIRDYSNVRVFKEQDVYPIVFIIQNNINKINVMMSKMSSITEVKIHNEVPYRLFYQDIYWDKYFVNPEILQVIIKISQHPPLIHSCPEILGASTVSEAYEIKNYLREYHQGPIKGIKKFINTGTIDPYTSLWGQCKTQYIKNSYIKPIIFDSDIIKVNRMRLAQANSNKIIIAGLSKRLECFFDTGEYLAGKSTIIILESINNKIQLKFLLSLLN
jgi:adenine-specific DNA-methyltransferase